MDIYNYTIDNKHDDMLEISVIAQSELQAATLVRAGIKASNCDEGYEESARDYLVSFKNNQYTLDILDCSEPRVNKGTFVYIGR